MPSPNPSAASPAGGALAGVRIVDLTTVVFGPYATQILADYGADVVKVESPDGDSTRTTGPSQQPGLSAAFLGVNRNKRSVVLDLKRPAARDALLALIDGADVFIHNIRPQKLAPLGLDAETLRARHPRLIYVGLHGFGMHGPYGGRPAYDDIIQGMSGIADLMDRQTGTPRYFPTIAADKTCGHVAAHAVLAALFQRERTGRGQFVEVPMFESMAAFVLVEHYYGRHLDRDGEAPAPAAGYPRVLDQWRRPYRTTDGHVCMMPYTTAHWQRFFEHSGHPQHAADPRFADMAARTRNIGALYALAGEIVATRSTDEWLAFCDRLEIPAARINRLEDLDRDPHLSAVGLFRQVTGRDGARYRLLRNPVTLSDSDVPPRMPPALGEHGAEVLAEAGLSPRQIAEALGTPPSTGSTNEAPR